MYKYEWKKRQVGEVKTMNKNEPVLARGVQKTKRLLNAAAYL